MEYKIYKAKTVTDAITDALIELEITSDMLDYEVVEEGSSGLLGLFSKNAVIKARRKEIVQEEFFDIDIKAQMNTDIKAQLNSTGITKRENRNEKARSQKKNDPAPKNLKADRPAQIRPAEKNTQDKKLDISVSKAVPEKKSRPENPEKPKKAETEHHIITGKEAEYPEVNEVLRVFLEKLDIKADIETEVDLDDKTVNINITGEDTQEMIGRKGQVLDAVQYIASIIINKKKGDYYRVKVDTNNYRERRQKTLENLAKNTASKVKKTHKKVVMEPMNPNERRIIHSYLQNDRSVTTKSEGEEPNRRIVVYYKKQ